MARYWMWMALCASLWLAGCAPGETPVVDTPEPVQVLTVMTHDSFDVSPEIVAAFEAQNNAELQFLKAGDTGTALNKAVLARGNPLGDVFYGVDNTFLSRALEEDIFEVYAAPALEGIPEAFRLDPENRALPVDFGDVCLNYDKRYFEENNLTPPGSLTDLLKPEYKDLLVVQNPATSSPGLAFLLVTISEYGPDGYLDYWQQLDANGLQVVNDWETAYFSEFTLWGGARPIVVSYGSSPPFEVLFAESPISEPSTAAVVAAGTCFRQIEFVGILKGTRNRELAERWVDFMLSKTFQEDLPLKMFVFPVVPEARLDPTFDQFLAVPEEPVQLAPGLIAAEREAWLQAWTAAVLR